MQFGLILPTAGAGADTAGIRAAADLAEQLRWNSVWATDHLVVDHRAKREYGHVFEALTTLAYAAGRSDRLLLGTSVIVVAQRNAVLLAKELATLDVLSGGRVIAGIGLGWNRVEFANLGAAARFPHRAAYLEETIHLWRHLWGGHLEPFRGRFHVLEDHEFSPVPERGESLPILIGGRHPRALKRAGELADGYHASQTGPQEYAQRAAVVRAAAAAAGRPEPVLSARVRVHLGPRESVPQQRFGPQMGGGYTLAGERDEMVAEVRAWADAGLHELVVAFDARERRALTSVMERFDAEVVQAFR